MNRAAVRRDLPYLRRRVKPPVEPAPAPPSAGATAAATTPAAAPGTGYSGGHPIVPRPRGASRPDTSDSAPPTATDAAGSGYSGGHPIVPRPRGASRPDTSDSAPPTASGASGAGAGTSGGSGLDLGRTAPPAGNGGGSGGGSGGSTGGSGLSLDRPTTPAGSGTGGSTNGSGSGGGSGSGLSLDRPGAGSSGSGTGLDLGSRTSSAPQAAGSRPVAPRSSGTTAGSVSNERRARSSRPERPGPFPAPTVDDVRELGTDDPVLRLNPRESAVGSLIISGTSSVAWETTDLVTGAATPDGGSEGTPVSTPGNRALVGYDGPDVIVSLRHLHRLRRALFIGTASGPIGVQLFDGSSFTVSTPDRSPLFALSLLRVGNLIELRAEPVTREATAAQLHREFGFSMTPHLTAREPRRR